MAIKIHHGPNGSYKTSGAVMDDVIPAIKQGRVVITNIRGMSQQRCREVFPHDDPNNPDTFELHYLDMDSIDGLERCRRFFQWAPSGALIIFDETQLLFLSSWREKDLVQFDYPGGIEAAKNDDRPTGWLDAWTRHRHWNWDIVLTTPNIKYIRSDIRLTCEAAYKHSNMGLLGPIFKKLTGDYKEAFHDAQLNTAPPKAITKFRRIKKDVWKLYDSTTTGVVKDTSAGTSILASMPLLIGAGIVIAAMVFAFGSGGLKGITDFHPTRSGLAIQGDSRQNSGVSRDGLSPDIYAPPPVVEESPLAKFLKAHVITIAGSSSINGHDNIELRFSSDDSQPFLVRSDDLNRQGILVTALATCMVSITYADEYSNVVGCYKDRPVNAGEAAANYSF